ncbi:MAG: serine hydrolase, partial [Bacteroidales bacterium]|nr:serine hydrolase [Bacteroidales bacterium]
TAVKQFVVPASNDYRTLEQILPKTLQELKAFDVVILDVQGTSSYPSKKYGITQPMVDIVGRIAKENNVVMALHANPYALDYFKDVLPNVETLVVSYDFKKMVQEITPEVLFGALPASGHLPVSAGGFQAGDGVSFSAIDRLRVGEPIEVGMDEKKLQKIDSVVTTFIGYGAMPGCEVLVAKNGVVVYEKAFGRMSYASQDSVTTNTIYDLASVTKSAATALSLMKLYEQNKLDLDKTMGDYLPYLRGTDKDTLVVRDVLTHQAYLKPGVAFAPTFIQNYYGRGMKSRTRSAEYPYMIDYQLYLQKDFQYAENAFSSKRDSSHTILLRDGLYMNSAYRDTVFRLIVESPLMPQKEVVYSDLGFYLMTDVVKNLSGKSLDEFTKENFYAKLGATTLGYLPLNQFQKNEIAPTETDEYFRRVLLQGEVHDCGAAILGGVSGHAGLFSNAYDLAKLLQMLVNGGSYGDEKFLDAKTIKLFTSCPFCENGNRKGLGFDKPEPDGKKLDPTCHCTSPASYGHTGFTGTLFWVDPDESLIYIFLSNRVNRITPDARNTMLGDSAVRPRIQRLIYNAII